MRNQIAYLEKGYKLQQSQMLILELEKPGKDISVYDIGLEYNRFLINTIKELKNVFSFGHMHASEYEWGGVANAFYHFKHNLGEKSPFPWIAEKEKIIIGCHRDVFYICQKQQEEFTWTLIDELLKGEDVLCVKSGCRLLKNLTELREGKNPTTVGWFDLVNEIFFFIDKDMLDKTRVYFQI